MKKLIVPSLPGKDFISLVNYTRTELDAVLDYSLELKDTLKDRAIAKILTDKILFLLFFNRSLRTRTSFEVAMKRLGGGTVQIDPAKIYTPSVKGEDIAYSTERISDVVRVLSRFGDGIAIRLYGEKVGYHYGKAHSVIQEFAKWASKPIINMECDKFHPLQALADMLTIKERFGSSDRIKVAMCWAYSPSVAKPLAVPHSFLIIGSIFGLDLVLAHPKGLELDEDVLSCCIKKARSSGGSLAISNNLRDAVRYANVVYMKSWSSKSHFPPESPTPNHKGALKLFESYRNWICDNRLMSLADREAIYMHCLPCDRGHEVSEEIIDGESSVVFEQAENRLYTTMAILSSKL